MMNTTLPCLLMCALAASPAFAQATDVGLTMDGGTLTVIYGQDCGPVTCTPFVAGPVGANQSRLLIHYAAPQTLYAIAVGVPAPCVAIPGIDNVLLLGGPIVLDWGITSTPPFAPLPCNLSQGIANFSLLLPANTPPGIMFRIQSLGVSGSGAFAFGPTIETITA
jgi:hypothetical protein